jgi:hypothetical protein
VENVTLTAWQWCALALVSIVAGVVVATYLKPAEKPDTKKNDK